MAKYSRAPGSCGLVWFLAGARSHHFVVYLKGGLKTARLKWLRKHQDLNIKTHYIACNLPEKTSRSLRATMKVPSIKLSLDEDTIKKVNEVLRSGIWAESKNVHALEAEFQAYTGAKYVRAVNNGTSALICALNALGIKSGDEVLVPSFSFIASANAILYFGAKPVFVDVKRDTFTIDVEDAKGKITRKTSGIMPVHLYGLPADMDALVDLCSDKGLKIIEDACQAHGSEYNGKKAGVLGDIAGFSLYPTKNMYCGGEGGLISTNDESLVEKIKLYSNHGQSAKYIHSDIGFNLRMQDTNALIARVSLENLDSNNDARRQTARHYNDELGSIDGVETPAAPANSKHVYHQYTLKVKKRDRLAEFLRENGIGFGIHYGIPIHQQESMIKAGLATPLPVTESLAKEVISLPVHPLLTIEEKEYVAGKIKEFYA
ncbi:MAG: DegT/DnrJ/EryC1/StrS family aminotransferase [Promethearchaeota archaeon]